jgi:hypothetical protein
MTNEQTGAQALPCRRARCSRRAIARGLCPQHWSRWYEGVDQLNLPGDGAPAPQRRAWSPPFEAGVSTRH